MATALPEGIQPPIPPTTTTTPQNLLVSHHTISSDNELKGSTRLLNSQDPQSSPIHGGSTLQPPWIEGYTPSTLVLNTAGTLPRGHASMTQQVQFLMKLMSGNWFKQKMLMKWPIYTVNCYTNQCLQIIKTNTASSSVTYSTAYGVTLRPLGPSG